MAAALLMLSASTEARLGETPDQIEARYGKPKMTDKTADPRLVYSRYESRGFVIDVGFLDGKSQAEIFKKPPGEQIHDSEVAALLQANSFGHKWVERERIDFDKRWDLGEVAFAHFALGVPTTFTILTRQMLKHSGDAEQKRLKGF